LNVQVGGKGRSRGGRAGEERFQHDGNQSRGGCERSKATKLKRRRSGLGKEQEEESKNLRAMALHEYDKSEEMIKPRKRKARSSDSSSIHKG
jgi:hypothetical protein